MAKKKADDSLSFAKDIEELRKKYNKLSDAKISNPALLALYRGAKNIGRRRKKGLKREEQLGEIFAALSTFETSQKDLASAKKLYTALQSIHDDIVDNEVNIMQSGMQRLCEKYMDKIRKKYEQPKESSVNTPGLDHELQTALKNAGLAISVIPPYN